MLVRLQTAPTSDTLRMLSYPIRVVILLMMAYTSGYIDRFALTILMPDIQKTFAVGDTVIGFLVGPAFALFFTLAGIPVARLADRTSRSRILALGCVIWSICTLLSGFSRDVTEFAVARIGVGLGEAACLAPSYSLIADTFPRGRRALAVGFFNQSVYIGQIAGLWWGGAMAAEHGWRATYVAIGWPGLLVAPLLWFAIREPRRVSAPPVEAFRWVARRILSMPGFWALVVGASAATFAGMGFASFAPTLLRRVYGMAQAEVGYRYGLTWGLASMAGALLAGVVSQRLAQRDSRYPLVLAAVAVFLTMMGIVGVCTASSAGIALLWAVPTGLANGAWLVPVQAVLQDLVADTERATAAALFACLSLVIGFLGPWCVGALSDHFAALPHQRGLPLSISLVSLASLVSVSGFLAAARRLPRLTS